MRQISIGASGNCGGHKVSANGLRSPWAVQRNTMFLLLNMSKRSVAKRATPSVDVSPQGTSHGEGIRGNPKTLPGPTRDPESSRTTWPPPKELHRPRGAPKYMPDPGTPPKDATGTPRAS